MDIRLAQIYRVDKPEIYKLHLACWNGFDNPLDVFIRDRKEWDRWNMWRGVRDDFSREFIFSMIDFYPEKDRWLFGGAYRVLSRKQVSRGLGYEVELLDDSRPLIGRLKVALKRPARAKAFNFEKHYTDLLVAELLPSVYTGAPFPGYDEIDLTFAMLESIIHVQKADWKTALEHAKGVYLISDRSNGKRYIGSAYGTTGVWSRWSCYVETGHGYTDELTQLINASGIEHARKHFRFTLLEHRTPKTDDQLIIDREKYWKNVLDTREHGYNQN